MSRTRHQLLLTSGDGDRFVLTVDRRFVELLDRGKDRQRGIDRRHPAAPPSASGTTAGG